MHRLEQELESRLQVGYNFRKPGTPIFFSVQLKLEARRNLSFQTASSTGETSTSSLMYTPRPSDAGRTMRCRAANPKMNVGVLEDSWTLDVQCKSTRKSLSAKKLWMRR